MRWKIKAYLASCIVAWREFYVHHIANKKQSEHQHCFGCCVGLGWMELLPSFTYGMECAFERTGSQSPLTFFLPLACWLAPFYEIAKLQCYNWFQNDIPEISTPKRRRKIPFFHGISKNKFLISNQIIETLCRLNGNLTITTESKSIFHVLATLLMQY